MKGKRRARLDLSESHLDALHSARELRAAPYTAANRASKQGYAVNRSSGEVHTRYASHAEGHPRTRTLSGVYTLTQQPTPCPVCWPPMPEIASYYCETCGRRHNEGSLVYERHREPTPAEVRDTVTLVDAGFDQGSTAEAVASGDLSGRERSED